jgi:hypothetical protein
MPKNKCVRRREWISRVTAWIVSGQSAETFCGPPRNWDPARLCGWRLKLESEGTAVPQRTEIAHAHTFARVVTQQGRPQDPPQRVELVLAGGRVLRFDLSAPAAQIGALADHLEVRT